jgi:hypothetical protein
MVTHDIGKVVMIAGGILVVVGLALTLFGRIPLLGKLPGDIHIRRGNFELYFPLATSIALSILVTLIFWIIARFTRR